MSLPAEEKYPHITVDQDILGGQPVIEGTRIPVGNIIRAHQLGMDFDEILLQYPTLEPRDLHAAFVYYFDHQQKIDALLEEEGRPIAGATEVTV